MLNSKAYHHLPFSAAKALPFFLGKVKRNLNDPQRYVDTFPFSYKEGRRYGFAYSTFSTVIQILVASGFIDPVDKGGLRGASKSCNQFKLSQRWEDFGTEKFISNNWKCFTPKERELKI